MKFIISKTSIFNEQPHKDAKQVRLEKYKDFRTFETLEAWKERFPKDFKDNPKTGYTKDGHPYRIIDGSHVTIWIIEIKDLVKFVKKNGEIILSPPREEYMGFENLMRIEIYDDFRE